MDEDDKDEVQRQEYKEEREGKPQADQGQVRQEEREEEQ